MTIPASRIVNVLPGVVSPGGQQLAFNGVMLTANTRVPIGQALSFPSAAAVATFFGASSTEYALAQVYFSGFVGQTTTPGLLYFWQYNASAVAAYLRGASVSSLSLTQLQAISGTLSVTIDGTAKTAGSLNLSAATSFSNAATIIGTALGLSGGQSCTYDSISGAFVITSGTTGANSTITVGTGTAAASLGLATGATVSPGAAATTPAASMLALTGVTQNWVTFMTVFEPQQPDKLAFASWTSSQGTRYMYVASDSAGSAQVANAGTGCFAGIVASMGYSGTFAISGDNATAAAQGTTLDVLLPPVSAFVMGVTAAINFNATNGRITYAEKFQSGLAPTCGSDTMQAILQGNGYNFYGSYATAAQGFNFLYPGKISGPFLWADSYINEVWLLNSFQLALMTLLTQSTAIAYNAEGYAQIAQALTPTIQQALNFGAIRAGVAPSDSQAAAVNAAAGVAIDKTLATRGWYLQVKDPGATARANRQTPIINFWFMDGEAVQTLTMTSTDIL